MSDACVGVVKKPKKKKPDPTSPIEHINADMSNPEKAAAEIAEKLKNLPKVYWYYMCFIVLIISLSHFIIIESLSLFVPRKQINCEYIFCILISNSEQRNNKIQTYEGDMDVQIIFLEVCYFIGIHIMYQSNST